jgi:hypothetical protein
MAARLDSARIHERSCPEGLVASDQQTIATGEDGYKSKEVLRPGWSLSGRMNREHGVGEK